MAWATDTRRKNVAEGKKYFQMPKIYEDIGIGKSKCKCHIAYSGGDSLYEPSFFCDIFEPKSPVCYILLEMLLKEPHV